jgi:hypothetical protein
MSMIGCFYALKDEDLEAIIEQPARIKSLWDAPIIQPKQPSLIGKLFGVKAVAPPPEAKDAWKPSETPQEFDVDKAWHGIHFLLTGSDWEGEGPLAFILHGGREINEDLGYGPPHGFTSAEVKEISKALDAVNVQDLCDKADLGQFKANEIYPEIWDSEPREECLGYIGESLKELRQFVSQTASANKALIAYLG